MHLFTVILVRARWFLVALVVAGPASGNAGVSPQTRTLRDRKLTRSAVDDFTANILEAAHLIAERHVKKVQRADVVAWAIHGVYHRLHAPIPKAVAKRLTGIRSLTRADREALLRDVREQLGDRKELDQYRDIDFALEGMFLRIQPDAEQIPQREARDRPT
jgi:hypothetical protein